MKDKVKQFVDGIFSYEQSKLIISEAEISLQVSAGKSASGFFIVTNNRESVMKGVLYSSHSSFRLKEYTFFGSENRIEYHFDAEFLDAEEVIQGKIDIVSDCGESFINFTVTVEAPYCDTEYGKIKNIFQLTNLARDNWLEAKRLFQSQEFRKVLLFYDKNQRMNYDQIRKSASGSHALEEFLVASGKKNRIQFQVDTKSLKYEIENDTIYDKIVITKKGWGYTEIRISTDVPFITLDRKLLWPDNFSLNRFELEFQIHRDLLPARSNQGRIIILTNHDQIVIPIECSRVFQESDLKQEISEQKEQKIRLTDNYILFRTGKRLAANYVAEAENIIKQYCSIDPSSPYRFTDNFLELYRVHLLFMSGKQQQAKTALSLLEEEVKEWGEEMAVASGAAVYLESLIKRDGKTTNEACDKLRLLYQSSPDEWLLLWFLLYVDKTYKTNLQLRYDHISRQFAAGCKSPVLYYEAAAAWLEEPSIMKEIDRFGLQVAWFSVKYEIITREAVLQFAYLASHEKDFRPLVFSVLSSSYKRFKEKEILTVICGQLIKGQKKEKEYFRWFQEGVKEQVRVTEIQEYYLYTADENLNEIHSSILIYFQYENKLNDRKKAVLYAAIIKNRTENQATFESYRKIITDFAVDQLLKGKLSKNLGIIYNEILHPEILNSSLTEILASLLFRYEIICKNPLFKSVCVAHREMEKEVCVSFADGRAQIDLVTENTAIFLLDDNNNRYCMPDQYTIHKLLHLDFLIPFCYQSVGNYPKLLLYQQNELQYGQLDEKGVEIFQKVVKLTGLEVDFLIECEQMLVEYYYDNFRGEELEKQLIQMDFSILSHSTRIHMIELLLVRDLYHLAFAMIQKYGFEGIPEKRLLRLCVRLIPEVKEEFIELLTKVAFMCFQKHKYEAETLQFLAKYYAGSTDSMFLVWELAKEADLEILRLEEHLLAQVLFVENHIYNAIPLLRSYYNHGANKKLIRAALSYYAYKYLIFDYAYDMEVFDMMKKESNYEENDICVLALLKYYSGQECLSDSDINYIDFQLRRMEQKDKILPFFKEFKYAVHTPKNMHDKYYIEYLADPSALVTIHYYYDGCTPDGSYIEERMRNVCYGIFVKEIILFNNENFQYYIEEEYDGIKNIAESEEIQLKPDLNGDEDTKYYQVNLMVAAEEMNDDITVVKLLEHYLNTNYCISRLFRPL